MQLVLQMLGREKDGEKGKQKGQIDKGILSNTNRNYQRLAIPDNATLLKEMLNIFFYRL